MEIFGDKDGRLSSAQPSHVPLVQQVRDLKIADDTHAAVLCPRVIPFPLLYSAHIRDVAVAVL